MRTVVFAAILLGSTSLQPLLAQDQSNQSQSNQPQSSRPQTVPVQPERTPQQSEQSREQDRDRAEDVRVGRDWRAEERGADRMDRMGRNEDRRMHESMGEMDRDRTVGRNWRMRPDEERADRDSYDRGYYNEDRARRRIKICYEYRDGDEYCRYRD